MPSCETAFGQRIKGTIEIVEDDGELKLIIRTTDKVFDAIKEQGKHSEELEQQNLREFIYPVEGIFLSH